MLYEFLEFVLDTDQQTLLGPDGTIALRRQSFLVLHHLVERAPAVVSKNELLDTIWGHQAISSSAVAQTVRELRDALSDHAEHPRAIETRHRVGYRFIAEVISDPARVAAVAQSVPDELPSFAAAANRRRWLDALPSKPWVAMLAVLLALLVGALALPWSRLSDQRSVWPTESHARQLALRAMVSARHFEVGDALAALAEVNSMQDVPRLALWQAWLHLLRGERTRAEQSLAILDARRANLLRSDQLMLDALQHEAAGRFQSALTAWRVVYEMDPTDVDVGLALFNLQLQERSHDLRNTFDRVTRLNGIPSERLLLMSAQLAGHDHDSDRRATQAKACIAASGTRWPALSALARAEAGRSLKADGRISDAREMFASAVAGLERQGLLRAAIDLRLDQLDPALVQGDMANVVAELEALQQRIERGGDNYSAGRLLHARGRLARRTGHDEQAIAFYAAAAQQHESIGNWDGVASALSAQAGPMRRIGHVEQARAVLERATRIADEKGSASIRANVYGNQANLAVTEARYADARRYYEVTLKLFRELHDKRFEAVTLGNLANLAVFNGDLRSAEKFNREALALFRELEQPADIGRTLTHIASAALDDGRLVEADKLADEALGILRELDDPNRLAGALALVADIKLHGADLDAAEAMLDTAKSAGDIEIGQQAIIATLRGRVAMLRYQLPLARQQFGLALKQRSSNQDRIMQLASQLDMAATSRAEGHLVAAEQAARAAAVQAGEDHQPGSERSARLLLARIFLEQDRRRDAERELVAARALLDTVPHFDDEAAWTLLRARLDPPAERIERLQWLVEHAREHQQTLLELRATGALYAETNDPRIDQWRERVRALGLTALLRQQLVLGS